MESLGGETLLGRGGGAADAKQACDLGHLESGLAVQQEVAEQADGVVVAAAAAQEAEGGVQHGALGGGQRGLGDGGIFQPTGEVRGIRGHDVSSAASGDGGSVWRRSGKVTPKARKTIRC